MSRERGAIAIAAILVAGAFACVVTALPSAALGADRYALPKELAVHVTATAAALACIVVGRSIFGRLVAPLAGVILLAALSWLASGAEPSEAARTAGLLASSFVILACARAAHRPTLVAGLVAAAVLAAGLAIFEAHGLRAASPSPPSGTVGNRNALAHACVLVLPLVATWRRRWPAWLAIAVLANVVVMTRCRAAWIALALAVLVALVVDRGRSLRAIRGAAVAFVAGALLAVVVPSRLAWSTDAPYRDTVGRLFETDRGSGKGRLLQYRATLAMIAEHPLLGVGPGRWSAVYPAYAVAGDPTYVPAQMFPINRLPSSDWLGIAAALGVPALGLIVVFALRAARGGAVLATVVALAVLGSVDTVLGRPVPALFAALALGALLPPIEHRGRGASTLACVLALAVAVHAALLVAAGLTYGDGRAPARIAAAARIAPGGPYFATYHASYLLRDRDCTRGRAIAARVLADFPRFTALRELAQACTSTQSRGHDT